MASTYLTKTFSGAGNRKTWTMSAWIKRSALASSSDIRVFGWKSGGGNYGFQFDSDKFRFYLVSGGSGSEFLTNRLFRDTNAWYHIVAKCDTTQSTASDRFKIYVNGVQETSFSTATYPNQNEDTAVNQAEVCRLGCSTVAVNSHFDGLMSHVHFTDGYAYDASAFGSTDSTTGEWQINTSPSVTYGTNGFFLLKDDNAVTDRSGQGNNFTLGAGTLTKTEDCPSNVFATFNRLVATNSTMGLTYGNTKAQTGSNYSSNRSNSWFSSLGMSTGKYYAEFKPKTASANLIGIAFNLSIAQKGTGASQYNFAYSTYGFAYQSGAVGNDSVGYTTSGYDAYTADDIIGIAVDLDNNKLYVSKNGTFQNSADPANGTGGYSITADKEYFFAVSDNASGTVCYTEANFGNGYFATTAVSSAGTNASGNGIFEYDVPTGFTALSTKGLNL
jgi:hypothetical protein